METNEFVAEYDVGNYISNEIKHYLKNKDEFTDLRGCNEEDYKWTDKEIEDYFWQDEYMYTSHWEFFEMRLDEEFTQHIGKDVYVEGSNMGWRNLSGEKTFTINDAIDMFHEIVPECDLTYTMEKVKEGEYEVRIAHHDSPMGEYYNLKIK